MTTHFRIRAYGKSELAQKYMTERVTDRRACQFLASCISKDPELHERLRQAGYCTNARRLTPLQVRIIVEAIGPPDSLA